VVPKSVLELINDLYDVFSNMSLIASITDNFRDNKKRRA